MFFRAHSEGRIGYKQLTDADLGKGTTTHQTHIGLFDDILTFLYDQRVEEEAMLIFNNNSDMVDCFFDRIENLDGSFRSPKIRKGNAVSVVTVIRDWAISEPMDYKWYLIWFGLESGMVVFYLFNDHMPDYDNVSRIIDLSRNRVKGRITSDDPRFDELMNYLEKIVNDNSAEILKQLEVVSQTGTPVHSNLLTSKKQVAGKVLGEFYPIYSHAVKLGPLGPRVPPRRGGVGGTRITIE